MIFPDSQHTTNMNLVKYTQTSLSIILHICISKNTIKDKEGNGKPKVPSEVPNIGLLESLNFILIFLNKDTLLPHMYKAMGGGTYYSQIDADYFI